MKLVSNLEKSGNNLVRLENNLEMLGNNWAK